MPLNLTPIDGVANAVLLQLKGVKYFLSLQLRTAWEILYRKVIRTVRRTVFISKFDMFRRACRTAGGTNQSEKSISCSKIQ